MKIFRAFPFQWGSEEKEKEFADFTILIQAETVEEAFEKFYKNIEKFEDDESCSVVEGCDIEEVPFEDGVEDICTEPIRIED